MTIADRKEKQQDKLLKSIENLAKVSLYALLRTRVRARSCVCVCVLCAWRISQIKQQRHTTPQLQ